MRFRLLSLAARATHTDTFAGNVVPGNFVNGAAICTHFLSCQKDRTANEENVVQQRRRYGSVAVFDEEDERPPSLRKTVAKKEEVVFSAVPRDGTGKIWCKKGRKSGLVPAIVFEQENGHLGGNKRLIAIEKKQVANVINKIGKTFFLSKTYDLAIYDGPGGELQSKERVLPRTIHLHASTDDILNVTFIRTFPHTILKVDVPLVFIGEDSCPGIRKGGYINTIMRKVSCVCPGEAIPPFIEVDISSLDVGQKILLKDLKIDPRLKLRKQDNLLPVLKVMGTRSMEQASASK